MSCCGKKRKEWLYEAKSSSQPKIQNKPMVVTTKKPTPAYLNTPGLPHWPWQRRREGCIISGIKVNGWPLITWILLRWWVKGTCGSCN